MLDFFIINLHLSCINYALLIFLIFIIWSFWGKKEWNNWSLKDAHTHTLSLSISLPHTHKHTHVRTQLNTNKPKYLLRYRHLLTPSNCCCIVFFVHFIPSFLLSSFFLSFFLFSFFLSFSFLFSPRTLICGNYKI